MRPLPALAACATLALSAACASLPAPAPLTYLDERTGITLTVVDTPIVLARERRDLAANARDYLTLAAVTRNESGRLTTALIVHRWSTIDNRVAGDGVVSGDARLVMMADGRDIRLTKLAPVPREFEPSDTHRLWRPDVSLVDTAVYRVDAATLRYVAESARVSAHRDVAGDDLPFSMWRDGRAALGRLTEAAR
jgi:hypothetical protein